MYDDTGVWNPDGYADAGASVAAVVYTGEDESEEMHVFFAMGWFDMESWAWGHYIVEWGTQGVFQVCVYAEKAVATLIG